MTTTINTPRTAATVTPITDAPTARANHPAGRTPSLKGVSRRAWHGRPNRRETVRAYAAVIQGWRSPDEPRHPRADSWMILTLGPFARHREALHAIRTETARWGGLGRSVEEATVSFIEGPLTPLDTEGAALATHAERTAVDTPEETQAAVDIYHYLATGDTSDASEDGLLADLMKALA